ncbi:hypothetical protein HanRHA438_Chr03g0137821 [Helianthus annuus]|nr:hypothetical protein HanRHA438_Chr03g0137821 [Helianthus annuus]
MGWIGLVVGSGWVWVRMGLASLVVAKWASWMGLGNGSRWVWVKMGIGQDGYFKKRVGWVMGQDGFGLKWV